MAALDNVETNKGIITLTCDSTIYPLNDRSILSILANGWDTIEYEYKHGYKYYYF
jgi:hypothetical protein